MKRRLMKWGISAAVVAAVVALLLCLPSGKTLNYGLTEGKITFSESSEDITDQVISGSSYVAAQNANFALELTGSADIVVRCLKTGRVWKAVPDDAAAQGSRYASSLNLIYYAKNAQTTLYSQEHCVDKEQVRVFSAGGQGVDVEYIFGDMEPDYVYPEQISQTRMEELFTRMDGESVEYLQRRYTLYSLDTAEGATRDYLLSEYPRLAEEDLYILTDAPNKNVKKRTDEIFRSAGYTEEDRLADTAGQEAVHENPRTFKVRVQYRLTDTGFTASVNMKDASFYRDYPLTNIELLPNFDSFTAGETGYMVIPSGSGALVRVDGESQVGEQAVSLPVYGQNIALTSKLDTSPAVCTLPVFGQYKNGSGFLCVVEDGAQQAEFRVNKSASYSGIYPAFMTIDTGIYQMATKTDTSLFASDLALDTLSVEYVLLTETTEQTAYSDMANLYRLRLENQGVLNAAVERDSPQLLAEVINSIPYWKQAAGLVPVIREYPMTTFAQAGDMAAELSESLGTGNVTLLLNGWNKKGLNCQLPGSTKISSAAGGEKAYADLLDRLKQQNTGLYTNWEFTTAWTSRLNGYFPLSSSARALNNSIVNLFLIGSPYGTWMETSYQLVSSKQFETLWEKYRTQAVQAGGISVSQLASTLYGDYGAGTTVTRQDTMKSIQNILQSMKDSGAAVMGTGGNLYTLPYLSYIDQLPATSSQNNLFDEDIPFVQMVLHGHIAYSGGAMNKESDPDKALLQRIETGSDLRYTLTANPFDELYQNTFDELYNSNYAQNKERITEQYAVLRQALNGLADQAMVAHESLGEQVKVTTYADGTRIYVNYGSSDYRDGDNLVRAGSYLRIDAE